MQLERDNGSIRVLKPEFSGYFLKFVPELFFIFDLHFRDELKPELKILV